MRLSKLAMVAAAALVAASGQETKPAASSTSGSSSSSGAAKAQSMLPRVSFGGRIGFAPLKGMSTGNTSTTVTTGNQTVETSMNSTGASRALSGGLTAEIRVLPRWTLNIDAMLRKSGWESINSVKTSTTTSTSSTTTTTSTFKRVDYLSNRFNYLDFPILLRRYRELKPTKGRMTFYTGGITLRKVQNIKSMQYYTTEDSTKDNAELFCCTENTVWPTKSMVMGATVGAGLRVMDDFKFKITPEFRYTRWLGRNYDPRPTRQNANQIELLLSITF